MTGKKSAALVLLSGGLDSATCLYWAKREVENGRFSLLYAITFDYFGRLDNEKKATTKLAKSAGVMKLIKVDISFLKESADFYNGDMKQKDADSRWSSYIPARNMIFYSIAAHYAEFMGIKWIIGGHNLHDVTFFKDASKQYFEKMNSLFREGCLFCEKDPYRIILPFAEMDRIKIIKEAFALKVPIDLTWSCHSGEKKHCGKCYACIQRQAAFTSLGKTDPVFT